MCINIKRLIVFLLIIILVPTLAFQEDELSSMSPEEKKTREQAYNIKIEHKKSEADTFMKSIDETMKEELVRSVLSENDEIILAKMLWGEDRENPTYMRAAVIWCVFNRMDISHDTIENIINPISFPGYMPSHPVKKWAIELIRDVAVRYVLELNGFTDVGRVLPKEFLYYEKPEKKRYHIFKTKLHLSDPGNIIWDWSLPSPY